MPLVRTAGMARGYSQDSGRRVPRRPHFGPGHTSLLPAYPGILRRPIPITCTHPATVCGFRAALLESAAVAAQLRSLPPLLAVAMGIRALVLRRPPRPNLFLYASLPLSSLPPPAVLSRGQPGVPPVPERKW